MNALLAPARDWLDAGLAFFYPSVCQLCNERRATPAQGYVCAVCWQNVRFIVPPRCERCGLPFPGDITTTFECANCRDLELHFRWARASVVANDFLRDVIHRYKYSRALWFEPFLTDLLVRVAEPVLREEKITGIVPVPLHPVKQREREFNQADRLAQPLAQALGVPVLNQLVQRIHPTRTQTQLDKEERADNVRRAFAPVRPKTLRGERLVVLDDILTTGATTSTVARVLRENGAGDVLVWTLARGL
ncbi:MAG: ComF family protein [Proteobacteria bacterium]|nr:ComF family protein [Pseudomonadota bacterium]